MADPRLIEVIAGSAVWPLLQCLANRDDRSQGGFTMKIRRAMVGLLACVATSAMIQVATSLSARADDLLNVDHHLPLINTGSAKCFEPRNWPGLPVQQITCTPPVIRPGTIYRTILYYQFQFQGFKASNDQGWLDKTCNLVGCIPNGPEGYLIANLDNKLCLEVRDGSKSDSAVVQQSTCNKNARSMLWYVQPGDFPDMFKVRNFNSDRCLDVKGGSSAEGAQLQQYRCTSTNLAQNFSQKFPADWPVIDVNGRWTDGSTRSAVIFAGLGSMVIDMSAFNRPDARGRVRLGCSISVDFPDDAIFTGVVSPCYNPNPTRITWSNGSVWTKKP
jgi:Ricin-type beta-trefoil lectin domain-like